jgi:HD-GYP domain-containing protein (c-di-GMP phosphodiesterase class II)
MPTPLSAAAARDLAVRLSEVAHSRRVYSDGSPLWTAAVEALWTDLEAMLEATGDDLFMLAHLGGALLVCGVIVPLSNEPLQRLARQLAENGLHVLTLRKGGPVRVLDGFLTGVSRLPVAAPAPEPAPEPAQAPPVAVLALATPPPEAAFELLPPADPVPEPVVAPEPVSNARPLSLSNIVVVVDEPEPAVPIDAQPVQVRVDLNEGVQPEAEHVDLDMDLVEEPAPSQARPNTKPASIVVFQAHSPPPFPPHRPEHPDVDLDLDFSALDAPPTGRVTPIGQPAVDLLVQIGKTDTATTRSYPTVVKTALMHAEGDDLDFDVSTDDSADEVVVAKPELDLVVPAPASVPPPLTQIFPLEAPVLPAQEPSIPAQEPILPAQEPTRPAQEPTLPAQEPALLAQEPTLPAQEPRDPGQEPVVPAQEPVVPAQEPVIPAQEPSVPMRESSIPALEASLPAQALGTPAQEPTAAVGAPAPTPQPEPAPGVPVAPPAPEGLPVAAEAGPEASPPAATEASTASSLSSALNLDAVAAAPEGAAPISLGSDQPPVSPVAALAPVVVPPPGPAEGPPAQTTGSRPTVEGARPKPPPPPAPEPVDFSIQKLHEAIQSVLDPTPEPAKAAPAAAAAAASAAFDKHFEVDAEPEGSVPMEIAELPKAPPPPPPPDADVLPVELRTPHPHPPEAAAVAAVPVAVAPEPDLGFAMEPQAKVLAPPITLPAGATLTVLSSLTGSMPLIVPGSAPRGSVTSARATVTPRSADVDPFTMEAISEAAAQQARPPSKAATATASSDTLADVYRTGSAVLREVLRPVAPGVQLDMEPVRRVAERILGLLARGAPLALLQALRDRTDYAAIHALNVAVLSGAQAQSLALPDELCLDICLSGLLHDVGRSSVPEAVLAKRGVLTDDEKAQLAAHTREGARRLLDARGAGTLAPLVATEHHSEPDVGAGVLPWSQLVALADHVDLLRTLRPFDDRAGLRAALTFMQQKRAERFSPLLLGRLAGLVGIYAAGDPVHLLSGEVAVVEEGNLDDGFRPKVKVQFTALGKLGKGVVLDLSTLPTEVASIRPVLPRSWATLNDDELDALG